jgi:PmbA protein
MTAMEAIERIGRRAQSAYVNCVTSEQRRASLENGKLKSVGSTQSTQITVRVIVEGRLGVSMATGPEDLDGAIERALETARFGAPVAYEYPGFASAPEVEVYDARAAGVGQAELADICRAMAERLQSADSEAEVDADASASAARREFATSAGAAGAYESSSYSCSVGAQRVRGTDIFMVSEGASRRDTDLAPLELAECAAHWMRHGERAATLPSRAMPVLFVPQAAAVLFMPLMMGISGKNVVLGASPLSGRLGERIAVQSLTVTDDPLIDFASGSGRYDGEAIPRRRVPILENGRLRNFLYDLDAAAQADAQPTGHGPGCSASNAVVAPGDVSFAAMLGGIREGLLVRSVMGLGQGNTLSGAFSVNVHLGYKIENGEITGRVKDTMLAGNAYDALERIAAIADANGADGIPPWSQTYCPAILVEGLNVTGK